MLYLNESKKWSKRVLMHILQEYLLVPMCNDRIYVWPDQSIGKQQCSYIDTMQVFASFAVLECLKYSSWKIYVFFNKISFHFYFYYFSFYKETIYLTFMKIPVIINRWIGTSALVIFSLVIILSHLYSIQYFVTSELS